MRLTQSIRLETNTGEARCFTMGIRQLTAENGSPRIEFSAITEIDRPDFPKWDKLNAVTFPHEKTIRYFSDTKERLENLFEGYAVLKALENPEYFENFLKKYPAESAKAELSRIDDNHRFHEQVNG